MAGFWSGVFGGGSRGTRGAGEAARRTRAVLGLEALADRALPSVVVIDGDIHIWQTNSDDHAAVYRPSWSQHIWVNDNGQTHLIDLADLRRGGARVFYAGFDGDDHFENGTALRVVADGGPDRDTLEGGSGDDQLAGGLGIDHLYGGGGNDVLEANGSSNAEFSGNYLDGGDGNDTMHGADGGDTMHGGSGDDLLYGYTNYSWDYDDEMYGGAGYDQLLGGFGNDYLNGGDDGIADYLEGGYGGDTFQAEWEGVYGKMWNRDAPADRTRADRVI